MEAAKILNTEKLECSGKTGELEEENRVGHGQEMGQRVTGTQRKI